MQLLGVGGAEVVDEALVVLPDRIDDERVAFIMADRLAVPGRLRIFRMRYVHIDAPYLVIAGKDHPHFFWGLDEIKGSRSAICHEGGDPRRHAARTRRK